MEVYYKNDTFKCIRLFEIKSKGIIATTNALVTCLKNESSPPFVGMIRFIFGTWRGLFNNPFKQTC